MKQVVDSKQISHPNFYTFLEEVLAGVNEGFELSDDNAYFPVFMGGSYHVTLVKTIEKETTVEKQTDDKKTASKEDTEEPLANVTPSSFEDVVNTESGAAGRNDEGEETAVEGADASATPDGQEGQPTKNTKRGRKAKN